MSAGYKTVAVLPSPLAALVIALDIGIALYGAALLVVLATGGLDLGWLSVRQATKPILMLWILVPIRVALHSPLMPSRSAGAAWGPVKMSLRAMADRTPVAVRDVVFAFVITRVATFAVAFLVNLLFPAMRSRPFALPFGPSAFAEIFVAWDSGWYFDIATRGYYYSDASQSSVAFFPLYPLAMRAAAWPFGSSSSAVWSAGIGISCVAFLCGLLALHQLTERFFNDREVARRSVLYACVFPFSFFLTTVYPSALFFLLTVVAVSAAHRSHWWLAGLCGGLATLTRPHGILIGVPLFLMAVRASNVRQALTRLIALTPVPAAFVAYSLYVHSLAGTPLAWLTSQRQWGYSLGHPPWEQLLSLIGKLERYGLYDYFFTSKVAPFLLFHGAAALFMLAIVPTIFKRLGAPLGAYVLISLVLPLTGNMLTGNGRYAAVLFPVFMVLATLQSPRFHEALLIVWSLFLALFVGLFVTWQPIY